MILGDFYCETVRDKHRIGKKMCETMMKLPSDNPSVSGIIAGMSNGRMWIDETHSPGIIVTYSYCVGGYGIVGDVDPYTDIELKTVFDHLFDRLISEGEEWFEFSAEDPKIYNRLLSIYSDKEIESEEEYSYRRNTMYDSLTPLQEEIMIRTIDSDYIGKIKRHVFSNEEMFYERYIHSWKTEEDFLKYSKAMIAIKNERLVGIIFGSSNYENVITVDIEVEEALRGQGIATRLTQELVNCCAKENRSVQWDCTESNTISRNLVQKLAFTPLKKRPYYWFKIKG
ncbi:MAG: GNAT family N-acetyltransferase [Clostridiales bacterium]|nr:GNAT family N-acetyltransferase [Clostridiales bacterium]